MDSMLLLSTNSNKDTTGTHSFDAPTISAIKNKHLLLDSSYSLCHAGFPYPTATRTLHRHFPFIRKMDGAACDHQHT